MIFRIGRKIRWTIFILLIGIMIMLHSCMTFRMSPKEIDAFFEKNNVTGITTQLIRLAFVNFIMLKPVMLPNPWCFFFMVRLDL